MSVECVRCSCRGECGLRDGRHLERSCVRMTLALDGEVLPVCDVCCQAKRKAEGLPPEIQGELL